MPSVREVERVKAEAADLRRRLDEARGRLASLKGAAGVPDADADGLRASLGTLRAERHRLQREFAAALAAYEGEYRERFAESERL